MEEKALGAGEGYRSTKLRKALSLPVGSPSRWTQWPLCFKIPMIPTIDMKFHTTDLCKPVRESCNNFMFANFCILMLYYIIKTKHISDLIKHSC